MLGDAPVIASLPVVDLDRAKKFYQEILGLKPIDQNPGGVTLESGNGTNLFLYPRGATKADHTVAGFLVQDVEKEVRELKGKGVVFEEYNTPEIKTVDSIATLGPMKGAWFKDTEGNILRVVQTTPSQP